LIPGAPANPGDPGDFETPWAGEPSPVPLNESEPSDVRFAEPEANNPGPSRDDPPAAESPLRAVPVEPAQPDPSRKASRPREDQATGAPRKLETIATPLPAPIAPQAPAAGEPPERVTLPWANVPQCSPELAAALRQADEHVRHGISLTERNALYLARSEFLAALQLVAQANDAQQSVQFYSDALSAGLTALDESDDFVRPRRVGKKLDIQRTIAGHKTPILKQEDPKRLSPAAAAKRYQTYAQEQLGAAAGREPSGSRALFGLGKLAVALGQGSPAAQQRARTEATVFYQAALLADSMNGRAANELGVLLARSGEFARARDLLVHSVRLNPHPSTHRNLAAVYAKLGQASLAEQAVSQAVALERAGHRRSGPAVQWLDPATFAATAPASDALLPPVAKPAAAPASTAAASEGVSTARKGITDWLPWNPRR
jgi:tetratricopeptide (TPR) repeat protein